MGNQWKDKELCKGWPELYRLIPTASFQDRMRYRQMKACMDMIKHYGQRYNYYFAPEFMLHARRWGDPFQNSYSSSRLMPSGRSFSQYLYAREQIFYAHECVMDFTMSDFDPSDYEGVPPIDLSDSD